MFGPRIRTPCLRRSPPPGLQRLLARLGEPGRNEIAPAAPLPPTSSSASAKNAAGMANTATSKLAGARRPHSGRPLASRISSPLGLTG